MSTKLALKNFNVTFLIFKFLLTNWNVILYLLSTKNILSINENELFPAIKAEFEAEKDDKKDIWNLNIDRNVEEHQCDSYSGNESTDDEGVVNTNGSYI